MNINTRFVSFLHFFLIFLEIFYDFVKILLVLLNKEREKKSYILISAKRILDGLCDLSLRLTLNFKKKNEK